MFSGFTASQGSGQTDFGEQMINTVASQSIRRMFSQCDSVDVDISCFPSSKLMQGNIDSFKMKGKGLVIKRQFQVDEMSFETDAIAVDFSSVLRGQIRLKQPTQAIAQVKLSEAGINRAFNAELVQQRLEKVVLNADLEGINGPVSFSHISIKLLSTNQVEIQAKVDVSGQRLIPIAVRTNLTVERRRRLLFTEPEFQGDLIPTDVRPLAQQLTTEFVTLLNSMIDLDRFDLDGVEMRINRVEIQPQGLLFSGYAQVNHFPGGKL
jgi:bifunctional DNA-binding transcriptional regulator/antitoxin component of YhaV-PrlF toxin-antitoxin module